MSSRVGKMPIAIPAGVQVRIEGNTVEVKGPKGSVSRTLPEGIEAIQEGSQITVKPKSDSQSMDALHGLTRRLIANMVQGVTGGFSKSLELVGVGYRAAKTGRKLSLTVGFSHPVEIDPPQGIEFEVPNPTLVVVKGVDKEAVGQVAARIRRVRPPEPYQGKGIRYMGERIRRKAGKAVKK
ncbi:MAG TPA: 50S ribosomal protein L6 [Firmicutes bacterium]|nr:50S ribosomal protein L6 [Bacillota bacterium]